ncbi:MAG: VWA domain-containing protein [Pseudomonadales bacterium]|nr:VWA domain-containing protein [Pseudomonadales bacterium]
MISADWWGAFLFLPLPWLIKWFAPAAPTTEQAALRVPFYNDLKELGGTTKHRRRHGFINRVFPHLIWFCLVFAASGLHLIGPLVKLPSESRDLMIAVDLSTSMNRTDYQLEGRDVDRLQAIKSVLSDFIERREEDRLGLILFGTKAYLQSPLTYDKTTIAILLNESQIGIAGSKTAIGDAIGLAIKKLKSRPTQSRVLILLTDGTNTSGELTPIKAAQLAATTGLKIYTIGIGAKKQTIRGLLGSTRVDPSKDLDEETLKTIAEITGGQYFRGQDLKKLEEIYALLDELEPADSDKASLRPRRALFHWPLGIALILSAIMVLQHLFKYGVHLPNIRSSISEASNKKAL